MKQVPQERQTLMFSATWPKAIKKLAGTYLKEAVHVNVGETDELAANKSVTQEFVKLNDDEKDNRLWRLMDTFTDKEKCIVFANTKRRIDKLSKDVLSSGYNCVVMSGDKTQQERDQGLADFVSGKSQIMFATDVCSRGLDIKGVTHVINYDMARDVDSYIHRIGRTGRAGMSGTSITFVNDDYDIPCSPALAKIAKEAGQAVPDWLEKLVAKAANGKKDKLWQY
jgi:superfamily II DNA/RNA helicase